MTLKCKKIRGVDKSVCTAEQMIAYNYAFMFKCSGKKILSADVAESIKSNGIFQLERLILNDLRNKPEMQKYNIDAIMIAFRAGFKEYCKRPFIACSYDSIGKCFAIPYDII